jgi:hypothetical protein
LPPAKLSDDEFSRIIKATRDHRKVGGNNRQRRSATSTTAGGGWKPNTTSQSTRQALAYLEAKYPHRLQQELKNGTILVGSDFHIWPGQNSTALRAFKKLADDLRPNVVILNGDVLDFPSIGRHAPIMWESAPEPWQEIEAAQDHLDDIAKACRRARKIWTLGNHDARFEANLANNARQYRNIKGVHLSDHFGLWEKGWSCRRQQPDRAGPHHDQAQAEGRRHERGEAPRRSIAAWSFVHGHLHSQKVSPVTDYNGDRYGVDGGMIADPSFKQFVNYTEDARWIGALASAC